jgi:methyl-accepting chemotaxis protein
MKRSTIMQRLVLLTAIPLITLMLFSGVLLFNSFSLYQSASQTQDLMGISVAAGNLIHTLQSERGATAGFVQSAGKKMADKLPSIRAKTDERLAAYKQQLAITNTNSMQEAQDALKTAQGKLDDLIHLREKAFTLSIPASESTAYFTGSIGALLDVMDRLVKLNKDQAIAQEFFTYQSLIRSKENAGQERALSMPVFTANKIELDQYRTILQKRYKQEAYLEVFRSSASAEQKTGLQHVLDSDAQKEVLRMRGILDLNLTQGNFDVDPSAWFKSISEKIDGLHDVEILVADNINSDAHGQLTASRMLLLWQLGVTIIAIALSVVVSGWVARSVNRPLKIVVDAAEYVVENNDFSRSIPEDGTLETARVGQMNNRLIGKFRSIIMDTTRASTNISDAANSLSASSIQVSKSSAEQADAAASIAATFEEISVSVSETASNMHLVGEIADKQSAGVSSALGVMSALVQNVNGIATLIRQSDTSVELLDESSKKIGGIIQVIKDVADQTNLLALNAAIEAARAGEQGRGFAVVADEVRKLAERTSTATMEIGALIDDIQSHVSGTVTGMQKANTQVADTLELVGKTETALHAIGEGSHEVDNHVKVIAEAIREQDSAIQQIAVNLEKIAQMAEENSGASTSSSATAAHLNDLADDLRQSVTHLKV